MNHLIAPSLLAADFANLGKDIEMVNNSKADWFHLDIMDGVFVPNISFGFPVLEKIAELATKPLDAHLMIVEPQKFIDEFANLGIYMLTVHYETCPHLHRVVEQIKNKGMRAGVTLNPHTPVSALEEIINDIDMVLLMSVNPGFGAQKFIPNTIDKIKRTKELIAKRNANVLIEIDGGVNGETAKQLVDAGANVLVSGSYIFGAETPALVIESLKSL